MIESSPSYASPCRVQSAHLRLAVAVLLLSSPLASLPAQALPAPEDLPAVVLAEGQVTDAIGSGLKDVKVDLYRKSEDGSRGELLGSTSTDQFGDFQIEAQQAASGDGVVVISKEMFKESAHEVTLAADGAPPYVALTLVGSVTVRGSVKSALAETPIAGASVKLKPGYQDWSATTGEDGKFEIEGAYPGPGEVVVEAEGFGRESARVPKLEADEPVVIELKPQRIVKLLVVDDRDQPIPGVTIELADQPRGDFRLLITDEQGAATASGLHFDADSLAARLEHEGHVSSNGFDRPLELPKEEASSGHRLTMQRAARVSGVVTDAKDGTPVYGARVIVGQEASDAAPRDWTDTSGNYEVIGVLPGETVVTVHMSGFAPEMKPVTTKVGETAQVDFALSPPATIAGIIEDADGKPVAQAEIGATAWRGFHTLGIRAFSDDEGKFVLDDAPSDTFEIVVYGPRSRPKKLTVSSADPRPIKVTLESAPQAEDLQEVAVGAAAPEIKLKAIGEETIELASLRGKIVLVDFWATWCGPCLQEIPHLVEVHKKFGKREDFVMIGVSRDFSETDLTSFLKGQPGVQWLQVVGEESGADQAAEKFGVSGIPALFLIDRKGVVAQSNLRGKQIATEVDKLLKEAPKDDDASH